MSTVHYNYPADLAEKWSNPTLSLDRSRSASRKPPEATPVPPATPKLNLDCTFVSLKLTNMPKNITIKRLWNAFSPKGTVELIDIWEGRPGQKMALGKVAFKPPPKEEFWLDGRFVLPSHGDEPQTTIHVVLMDAHHVAPADSERRRYPPTVSMQLRSLDFGSLMQKGTMAVGETVISESTRDIRLEVNTKRAQVTLQFPFREKQKHSTRQRQYKLVAPVSAIKTV